MRRVFIQSVFCAAMLLSFGQAAADRINGHKFVNAFLKEEELSSGPESNFADQESGSSGTIKSKKKHGAQTKPELDVAYSTYVSTWTIPVTFARIEQGSDGKYRPGTTLGLGIGYVWIHGDVTLKPDSSADIVPGWMFGVAADVGALSSKDGSQTSLCTCGILGVKTFAVAGGYDWNTKSPVVGVSLNLHGFSLGKNSYAVHGIPKRMMP